MTPASPDDDAPEDDGDTDDDSTLATAYRLVVADVYEVAGRSRQTSEHLARSLRQTVPRWHLLSVLADGPRSVASAARRLGLARQSVQRVADHLRADGLVTSSPDPADARAPRFALTDDGRRALDQLVERSDEVRARQVAVSGLTVDDLRSARRVLRALADALGPSE